MMKLLLVTLFIASGYYIALTKMTDLALGSLQDLGQTYQHVAETSEQWAAGDTSANFIANN